MSQPRIKRTRKPIYSIGAGNPKCQPFHGELMTCVICGKQQRSDVHFESQWRGIEADGVMYYACPDELPPDGSSSELYKVAYEILISAIGIVRANPVSHVMAIPEVAERMAALRARRLEWLKH